VHKAGAFRFAHHVAGFFYPPYVGGPQFAKARGVPGMLVVSSRPLGDSADSALSVTVRGRFLVTALRYGVVRKSILRKPTLVDTSRPDAFGSGRQMSAHLLTDREKGKRPGRSGVRPGPASARKQLPPARIGRSKCEKAMPITASTVILA
jgi:hypothetical protein